MATASEVKAAMDAIAGRIASARQQRSQAADMLRNARSLLADIPTRYADVIATIDGYTPDGVFESLAQDEKTRLAAEFVALKTTLEDDLAALGVPI